MRMDMSGEKEQKELLPEGWRTFHVKEVVEGVSKKGNPQFVWTLTDEGTGQDETVYTITEKGKRWALKNLLKACQVIVQDGEVFEFELPDLVGKTVYGEVKQVDEKWINREGVEKTSPKTKIVKFDSAVPCQ